MSEPIEMYFNDFIKLNRGFDLPESNIVAGKYPIAASTSIKDYHKDFKVKAPCVTTGRSGSLGSVLFINQDCWPLNTTLYVKDFKGNNPKYVYYFLQTMKLESFNCGAGVPTLNQNHLHKVKVKIHKKDEQHRIASILYAYDDLIENNNRRIALLEQMAEQIYKEWFVRMRFPGYEKTEFEKGVPKGWEVTKVEKAFKYQAGGTPSREIDAYWKDGDINWFTPTDITGSKGYFLESSSEKCNEFGVSKSSAKLFPAYSLMMTSRATIGAIGINTKVACTNQGFITCIPNKKLPLTFLFYWLKLNKEFFISLSTGATFAELTKSAFKRVDIIIPDTEVVKNYDDIVKPIFNQLQNLQLQIQTLKQTRDLLLPRLISGKLKVNELKEFELV